MSGCCGFKLRGSYPLLKDLHVVYISPNDPYEPFQRSLRSRLKRYAIKVVCEPHPKVTSIYLSNPHFSEQVLAYGSSAEIQRYKISINLHYKLQIKENTCTKTIVRSRELSKSNNFILSNDSEEQTVKRELIEEAVNELLRQISRPSCNTPLQDSQTIGDGIC